MNPNIQATEDQLNRRYNGARLHDRQIDEMLGIIKGVLCDGMIMREEVEFLVRWIDSNRDIRDEWPASVIYPRLHAALADGTIDVDEEREIMELLHQASGYINEPCADAQTKASTLPTTQPTPAIEWTGKTYCFTGKFYSGTRTWCEQQIHARGAQSTSRVTLNLDYLVIGEIGNSDWIHSSHGRKIEQALEYATAHGKPYIIQEKDWIEALQNTTT